MSAFNTDSVTIIRRRGDIPFGRRMRICCNGRTTMPHYKITNIFMVLDYISEKKLGKIGITKFKQDQNNQ